MRIVRYDVGKCFNMRGLGVAGVGVHHPVGCKAGHLGMDTGAWRSVLLGDGEVQFLSVVLGGHRPLGCGRMCHG